jgi:hypothetical protein
MLTHPARELLTTCFAKFSAISWLGQVQSSSKKPNSSQFSAIRNVSIKSLW